MRDHNVAGYLPVELASFKDPAGKTPLAAQELPGFRYRVLAASSPMPTPDPVTGAMVPGRTILKSYRLEGNQVRRIVAPNTPVEEEAHPEFEEKKEKKRKH